MCGIAGVVRYGSKTSIEEVKRMTDSIAHRGPDGEGVWINENGNVGLGHRRLAIIDLSINGHQPMISADQRFVITFNGEIYNYIELRVKLKKEGHYFKTENDTEVLLKLYELKGADCLADLDGMFAFAIWDNETKELFCARDRFGEKPFNYFFSETFFAFGSEIKSLWPLGISKELNERMAYNYEFFGYKTNPEDHSETFYNNIFSLPASHTLTLKNGKVIVKKYYAIDLENTSSTLKFEDVTEQLRDLIHQSITKRRRGQVTIGSSFSGGLDSSIIVTEIEKILKSENSLLNTFSAIFPGFEKNEEKFIKSMIEGKGIIPHFILPNAQEYQTILDKLFYHHEEPFTAASVIAQYFIYKEAREKNVLVLLDGQGADEVFGGYHWYYDNYFSVLYKQDKKKWRDELNAYEKINYGNRSNKKINGGFIKQIAVNKFPSLLDYKRKRDFEKKLDKDRFQFYKHHLNQKFKIRQQFKSLTEELHYQTFSYGLPTLLRYADRNSMASGVEVRLPFLDHKIVELIFSLPDDYKINKGWTKWILRSAYQNSLPKEICWRVDKIGLEPNPESFARLNYNDALSKFKQTIL